MVNTMQNRVRQELIFGSLLIMLFSFFLSRAFLSVSLILLVVCCFAHKQVGRQLLSLFSDPLLAGISMLFFIPVISALWSSNMSAWGNIIRVKLPLLFMPLSFAGAWQLEEKRWRQLALCFVGICFIGTLWSMAMYLNNTAAVNESYLRSKMILTPLDDDHIRFSWMISIGILTCLLLIQKSRFPGLVFYLLITWFFIYLHILAARTGLLCTYVLLIAYAFWRLRKTRSFRPALIALAVIIALPVLSWLLLPTFKNRWSYIRYDLHIAGNGKYLPGGNDGNRVHSFRAGWDILKQHPFGVGAGDVYDETTAWYARHIPGMLPSDKLNPNSEWLYYGCIAGWPAIILFTAIITYPFFSKGQHGRFFWIALNALAALGFLFDVGLEVQYGVFLYALFILCGYKWFQKLNASEYVFHSDRM